MKLKWHLRDWNLNVIGMLLHAEITDNEGCGYWIKFGTDRENKTFIAFDNGGELNIFGLGFGFKLQGESLCLPAGSKFCQSNEDVIAQKINDFLDGELKPYYESILDEEDIEALK